MLDSSDGADALIADLCVRGAWEPQTEALFDIRVVDTDARSYRARTPHDVLSTAKKVRRSTNICRPVRISVPRLLHFVCLWMACSVL